MTVTTDPKLAVALKTLKEAGHDVGGTFVDPAAPCTSGLMMWLAPIRKSSGWLKMRKHATGKSRKRTSKRTSTRTKGGSGLKADNRGPQTRRKMRALGTKGKLGTIHESLNESHERK